MSLRGLRCVTAMMLRHDSPSDPISSPPSRDDSSEFPRQCRRTEAHRTDRIFQPATLSVSGMRREFLSRKQRDAQDLIVNSFENIRAFGVSKPTRRSTPIRLQVASLRPAR